MPTTASNFVRATVTGAGGVTGPAVIAVGGAGTTQLAATTGGAPVDLFTVNLARASYAKNGCVALTLAASTPVTLDLTATATGTTSSAGDTSFATLNEVIFHNYGLADVTVSPGAANPFNGPLGGTAPTFTVPAGARLRWHSPAGWAVSGSVKTLKFDPGASAAGIAVAFGGA